MRYVFPVNVPPGYTEDNPLTEIVHLNVGRITGASVHFHAGCHFLVKTRCKDGLFQFIPASGTDWITGDNETITMPLNYPLKANDNELLLCFASTHCEYPHIIEVSFDVQEDEALIKVQVLSEADYLREVETP